MPHSYPITKRQNLDSSKLKEFAEDNFKFDENGSVIVWELAKLLHRFPEKILSIKKQEYLKQMSSLGNGCLIFREVVS